MILPQVLGVDPSVNGGMALLDQRGNPVFVQKFDPTWTVQELVENVRIAVDHLDLRDHDFCCMEKVQYIRGDGGKGAFTFGRITGLLEGTLWTLNARPVMIPPMLWQSALGCLSGGNKNIKKARELFPVVKLTHAVADALLIAYYGQRKALG